MARIFSKLVIKYNKGLKNKVDATPTDARKIPRPTNNFVSLPVMFSGFIAFLCVSFCALEFTEKSEKLNFTVDIGNSINHLCGHF